MELGLPVEIIFIRIQISKWHMILKCIEVHGPNNSQIVFQVEDQYFTAIIDSLE